MIIKINNTLSNKKDIITARIYRNQNNILKNTEIN